MKRPGVLTRYRLVASFAALLAILCCFVALPLAWFNLFGGPIDAPPEISTNFGIVGFASAQLYFALHTRLRPTRKPYPMTLTLRFHLMFTLLVSLLAVAVALLLVLPPTPAWTLSGRQHTAAFVTVIQSLVFCGAMLMEVTMNRPQNSADTRQSSIHGQ